MRSRRPEHVGIVVAAHNAAAHLAQTLESIQAQTFVNWCCVVVDDGSTDGSAAVAQRFASADHRITVIRQANAGYCNARNSGLAQLTHVDAISIMDSDDVWLPNAIDLLADRMSDRPDCIGAHGLGEYIDESGARFGIGEFEAFGRRRISGESGRIQRCAANADTTFASLVTSSTVFPPGLLLMRREIYDKLGGYDELSIEGDWDLLIRATRFGALAFLDQVVVQYRRHGSNFGASGGMWLHTHMTRLRAHRSPDNTAQQRTVLRRCWRARQRAAVHRHVMRLGDGGTWRDHIHAVLGIVVAAGRYVRGGPGVPPTCYAERVRRVLSPKSRAASS